MDEMDVMDRVDEVDGKRWGVPRLYGFGFRAGEFLQGATLRCAPATA